MGVNRMEVIMEANTRDLIADGRTVLGIEFGSTRIKAVLIDEKNEPVASGSYEWENELQDHIWTYSLDHVWEGLAKSYAQLKQEVWNRYGVTLKRLSAIGISGMMHGYLVFDQAGNQLVPFRTWRNTMTEEASAKLTNLFHYNIPQRFSIAHLYQSVLNGESHIREIDYMTTLAGYVHWKLTGRRVLGVGDASGMFPIDILKGDYDSGMSADFDCLISGRDIPWKLTHILPEVLIAGEEAGVLTPEGAALLDSDRELMSGIPLCPPEGDAGTGMAATNSVAKRTCNVSAGTSIFAMLVLEKNLSKGYPEIDLVTTPGGHLVGMVHCNNCSSDLNAWVSLLGEAAALTGAELDEGELFRLLFHKAWEGDPDCGGLLSYNYVSGEHITGFAEGRPLFTRRPTSAFNLANFMRSHLYTAFGALKLGLDILLVDEKAGLDRIFGHGGLFKTKGVAQGILASVVNAPVSVLSTAGEGGAWGIALLASYLIHKSGDETLEDYLSAEVFDGKDGFVMQPDPTAVTGFETYMDRYKAGLAIERAAVERL